MSSPTSVEEICNIALIRVGYPELIGSIYDGTKQARAALYLYAQARDNILRLKNWPFAYQQIPGVASGVPPVGWKFSWAYPATCIRVRDLFTTLPSPNLDPQPLLWELSNNAQTPGTRYIVTQVTPIWINFIGQVVDMTTWEPGFVETVISTLAQRFGPLLRRMGEGAIDPAQAMSSAIDAGELQPPGDVPMADGGGRRQQQ